MTDKPSEQPDKEPREETDKEPREETDWERRRRLAAVFGDVLPETTTDEQEPDGDAPDRTEDWLKSQVPPHHG